MCKKSPYAFDEQHREGNDITTHPAWITPELGVSCVGVLEGYGVSC
jgi:hypothetical protein